MVLRPEKIAFIGAGPATLSTVRQLDELSKSFGSKVRREITIFEAGPTIGANGPFGRGSRRWINNMKASLMGLAESSPDAYVRDLKQAHDVYREEFPDVEFTGEYFPREVYGFYLKREASSLVSASRTAGEGIGRVDVHVNHNIACIHPVRGGYELYDSNGQKTQVFDRVVLATGTPASDKYLHLRDSASYIHSPRYGKTRMTFVSDDEVVLFGTSQTAADWAIAILELGFAGVVTMVSRDGQLPMVTSPSAAQLYNLNYFTEDAFQQFIDPRTGLIPLQPAFRLFMKEVFAATGVPFAADAILNSPLNHAEELETAIRAANAPLVHQEVMRAARWVIEHVWSRLSVEDQKRVKQFEGRFGKYRYPIAPPTANRLLELLKLGSVRILGGLQTDSVRAEGDRIVIECVQNWRTETIRSKAVLNTTGPGTNVELLVRNHVLDHGPIPRLLQRGLVTPHHAGGLRFDPVTFEAIDASNNPVPGLHLLGHWQKGQMFLISAMDRIVALAARLAKTIANT
jgi:uncharacterized NAD(P)/FAD-binding protein YdhS